MSQDKAVVLASGGLDSTVTAAIAKSQGYTLYFLTLDYGQRHQYEIECARRIACALSVQEHKVVTLDLRTFGGSALTDNIPVPAGRTETERDRGIPVTYVPARNTIFLSLALAYAEVLAARHIFIGANIRDYSGYPDCRPEFLTAYEQVANLGTQRGIEGNGFTICAPLLQLRKEDIIRKGYELQAPLHLTSSCYRPDLDNRPCGECDSCLIRREGFQAANVEDPIQNVS